MDKILMVDKGSMALMNLGRNIFIMVVAKAWRKWSSSMNKWGLIWWVKVRSKVIRSDDVGTW